MSLPVAGWKNKGGTGQRSCKCGTWKLHWIKFAYKPWPAVCSVAGCSNPATVGAHVTNPAVSGERIVPFCDSCNKAGTALTLDGGVTLPSANTAETCK